MKLEFFRVAPVIILFVSAAAALAFQSLPWTVMFVGLLLNGLIWVLVNPIIKKHYPELSKRPQKSQCYFFYQKNLTDAGGMPSGHCQSAAFFSMFLILMAINSGASMPVIISTILFGAWFTIGMMISRVHYYRCHTTLQATVGSLVGILTAVFMNVFL